MKEEDEERMKERLEERKKDWKRERKTGREKERLGERKKDWKRERKNGREKERLEERKEKQQTVLLTQSRLCRWLFHLRRESTKGGGVVGSKKMNFRTQFVKCAN